MHVVCVVWGCVACVMCAWYVVRVQCVWCVRVVRTWDMSVCGVCSCACVVWCEQGKRDMPRNSYGNRINFKSRRGKSQSLR